MTDRSRRDVVVPAQLLWLIAVIGLGGFAVLTFVLWRHVTPAFDPPIRDAALAWKAWDPLWDLISNAANFPLIGIGVAIVAGLLLKGRRREAILVIITLALVTAGSEGVKELVHRPRPPASDTVVPGVVYSFPSGHELEAVTILGIVALLAWRSRLPRPARMLIWVLVAVFVALVAVARVAINAHWPSDVLAGFLGGSGVLAVFSLVTRDERSGADRPTSPPLPESRPAVAASRTPDG